MFASRGFYRAATAVLLSVLVAGCQSTTTGSSQSTSRASDAGGDKTIRIGIDLPVSGADASTGIPTRNGAILAIEEADAAGVPGGYRFTAYDLDDAPQGAHDPAQGAQNVRQFVAEPAVVAMIGPFNSSVATAQIPITNDAGLTQISPATTNPGLTKGDAAKKLRTSHPDINSFFRVCATDDKQGAAGAAVARKLGFKKAFVIDDNETYGKGLADIFAAQFSASGGTIAGHEHLTKGQTDYKALLTKAHALAPDVVFYGGTTSTGGGQVRKQMADAGLGAVAYIGGDGISDSEFLNVAGSAANGTYFTVAAPETSKLPGAKAFIAAYRKRWKSDVGPYSANAYAATKIELAAVRKMLAAGGAIPSRADVLKVVAATTGFSSPIGTIGFDRNGDTTAGIISVYAVRNGKPQFVEQIVAR